MTEPRDYAAIALQYARDVVDGTRAACRFVIQACDRQLRDLDRQQTPGFPFRYEPAKGTRVCRMLELLPHIKGKWQSKTLRLEAWQIFILMTVFSWVWSTAAAAEPDLRAKDGLRRFRIAYTEVPRKNAKSTISAGVGLYMLGPDGEEGAECYSTATTKDQARIVFDVARGMAKRTPQYCDRFGVEIGAHALLVPESESVFKALSADDNSLDGLSPHFAAIDELHAHKTRGVYDVLETATGSRAQSLLWPITTAGSNRAGICYEVRTYLTKVLDGTASGIEAETYFGIIYTIDEEDDWTDPAVWAKANPNYGVSVFPDDIARACRKAQEMPSAQPNFLTKRLNVWVNADSPWMDMRRWEKLGDPTLTADAFAGEECFIGLDLASNVDIAARVDLFRRVIEEPNKAGELEPKVHYYVFGRFYLPEDVVEESDNSQYKGWERSGRLITTDGNIIDQNAIQDDIRLAKDSHQIREVVYDPFQATKFATELLAEGFPMVELGATVKNFSAPMKEIEALVRAGRLHHTGDPVLAWMMSNVVCHVDKKDNVFPNKQTAKNKIDGAVALIMAMGRAMHAPAPEVSVYETRGVLVL